MVDKIDEVEREKRRKATEQVFAMQRQAGLEPTEYSIALAARYDNGEITLEEYGRTVRLKYGIQDD